MNTRTRTATILLACTVLTATAAWGQGVRFRKGGVDRGTIKEDPAARKRRLKKAFTDEVAAAQREMGKKDWRAARSHLNVAEAVIIDKAQKDQLKALYVKLEEAGRTLYNAAAKQFKAKEYGTALRAFQRISVTFGQLPCAREARTVIEKAASLPDVQAVLQDIKAAAVDEKVGRIIEAKLSSEGNGSPTPPKPAKGKAPRKPRRVPQIRKLPLETQIEVVDLLTMAAERYPLSPTGKRAEQDLQELYSDDGFRTALDLHRLSERAKAALRRADTYRKSGMNDKAREYYKEVVQKYPDTPQAYEATKRMASLGS